MYTPPDGVGNNLEIHIKSISFTSALHCVVISWMLNHCFDRITMVRKNGSFNFTFYCSDINICNVISMR